MVACRVVGDRAEVELGGGVGDDRAGAAAVAFAHLGEGLPDGGDAYAVAGDLGHGSGQFGEWRDVGGLVEQELQAAVPVA